MFILSITGELSQQPQEWARRGISEGTGVARWGGVKQHTALGETGMAGTEGREKAPTGPE